MILHEEVSMLNEIDFEETFKDVMLMKTLTIPEAEEYFRQLAEGCERSKNEPKVPPSAFIDKEDGKFSMDKFMKSIRLEPTKIITEDNSKLELDGTVGVSIPALRGLVYDEEKKVFYFVNTCPGAGECVNFCYAMRGRYLYEGPYMKHTRTLNLLLNDPERFEEKLLNELKSFAKVEFVNGEKVKTIKVRWNDAGDFFAKKYMDIAKDVTRKLANKGYKILSYAYTKTALAANTEFEDDIKDNFVMTISSDVNPREAAKMVNVENKKIQVTVPKELFKNIFVKKDGKYVFGENPEEKEKLLKSVISLTYKVPYESLLMQDELLKITEKPENKFKYNVIVKPSGEADIGAKRMDVRVSFLCIH